MAMWNFKEAVFGILHSHFINFHFFSDSFGSVISIFDIIPDNSELLSSSTNVMDSK